MHTRGLRGEDKFIVVVALIISEAEAGWRTRRSTNLYGSGWNWNSLELWRKSCSLNSNFLYKLVPLVVCGNKLIVLVNVDMRRCGERDLCRFDGK